MSKLDIFRGGRRDTVRTYGLARGIASVRKSGGSPCPDVTGVLRKRRLVAAFLSAIAMAGAASPAVADETDARRLLQAMSDFLASQDTLTVDYDALWEVVTTEDQKLGLASSGTVALARPDGIRATRSNGFEDLLMVFDGKTFTLAASQAGVYASIDVRGEIDTLIDTLRDTYGLPFPAADLMVADPYGALMSEVVDIKDLGGGVIRGTECDHLAFRTETVDWQIWIAHGAEPFPCRFQIVSKTVEQGPSYLVDFHDWQSDAAVEANSFAFSATAGATRIEFSTFTDAVAELPQHFSKGENQ
jgi:hypothetical protein